MPCTVCPPLGATPAGVAMQTISEALSEGVALGKEQEERASLGSPLPSSKHLSPSPQPVPRSLVLSMPIQTASPEYGLVVPGEE